MWKNRRNLSCHMTTIAHAFPYQRPYRSRSAFWKARVLLFHLGLIDQLFMKINHKINKIIISGQMYWWSLPWGTERTCCSTQSQLHSGGKRHAVAVKRWLGHRAGNASSTAVRAPWEHLTGCKLLKTLLGKCPETFCSHYSYCFNRNGRTGM